MKRRMFTAVSLALAMVMILLAALPGETAVPAITTINARLLTSPSVGQPQPLVLGLNWPDWYESNARFTADSAQFGAYVMQAIGDELFIGLGSGRPAEFDGALIAAYDGLTLRAVGPLMEQGVHEMVAYEETLHVGGSDPCCGDGWEAGNHYTITAVSPPQKHRDPGQGLTNVIHTWGLWAAPNGDLYAATSAHEFQVVYRGQVWRSQDGGQNWLLLSNLGKYRAYDVTGFQGQLYALYANDSNSERNTLAFSPNGGRNWADLIVADMQRIHLTELGETLVGVSFDRTAVYALSTPQTTAGQTIIRYQLPDGYKIGSFYDDAPGYANYNLLTTADAYLYTVLEGGDATKTYTIVRSRDLQSWEAVASTPEPVISLAYWPARRWLIWGDNGRSATLWRLELAPSP